MEIIGVRLRHSAKVYYFSPQNIKFKKGDKAVVQTQRGVECGKVVLVNKEFDTKDFAPQIKKVVRKATLADLKLIERNKQKEKEAYDICMEKIATRQLEMHLVDVEFMFDGDKILFYFTADTRIDFRELVKDLAAVFRTRIELRQIGIRDKAKLLGGVGMCGREICCKSHLADCEAVSIKMAKEQGISTNSTKMSGTCGRLMCCLKNEEDVYTELLKITPRVGSYVKADGVTGYVKEVHLLTGKVKIKPDPKNAKDAEDDAPYPVLHVVDRKDVKVLKPAAPEPDDEDLEDDEKNTKNHANNHANRKNRKPSKGGKK
jgi:cell fate regulator YaaT (PSP1 superfamily)